MMTMESLVIALLAHRKNEVMLIAKELLGSLLPRVVTTILTLEN
jgi:hypothetical protein